ncbi:hypothetical protein V9J79_004483 [Vibrio alginolyticus]
MEVFLIFLALLVACMTLFVQRQHNRKELQPILSTYFSADFKDNVVTHEFKLINDGNGAAIIKKMEVRLLSGDLIEVTKSHSFSKIINENNPSSKKVITSLPSTLGSNSSELIYSYTIPQSVKDPLEGCVAIVTSESVYGDTIVADDNGFHVTSNGRDAFVEKLFGKALDLIIKLWNKTTNKLLKSDS